MGNIIFCAVVSNWLYINVPELVNLTNWRDEKREIFFRSACKRKLKQDQEKIGKTNKDQIKPKQKKKNNKQTKITSKKIKTNKTFFKKLN